MYLDTYLKWLNEKSLSESDRKELFAIRNDQKEIEYRFGKTLEFGTAGMRGILGMGTNMMNVFTVKQATQGLADYIKKEGDEAVKKGVVISYDTRRNSAEFAKASADVLASNGIKTYLYSKVHPVPMLSFAVKHLGAFAGIMITASHNPKEYNGYKVYGEDGAQMSPENTEKVVKKITAIPDVFSKKILTGKNSSDIVMIGDNVDKAYYKSILKLALSEKAVKKIGKKIKLVYTPVHGSGYIPVTTILSQMGINATVVEEQISEDTEFSTVKVPNPENKETLAMGIALANKIKADVVFGTDPDCDRLGVVIRNDKNEFQALSGNQTGILLLDYILLRLKEDKKLPKNGFVVKSFVTTSMAKAIADDYGIKLYEVPVGFKFIGEKIKQYDDTGVKKYVFGFEESCGYLRGTHCRDKDAVVASMLFAEMVCYYTSKKVSVYSRLCALYKKYGYVFDTNVSIQYSGLNAMNDMNAVVEKMKKIKIVSLGGIKVTATRDYSSLIRTLADGSTEKIDCSKANAVYYELEGGGFVCIRPSGTEPKLKVYYSVSAADEKSAKVKFEAVKADFEKYMK